MDGLAHLAVTIATLVCARGDALRPTLPAQEPVVRVDPWFGDDKFRHFAMSFATTTFTYAAVRTAGGSRDVALPAAVVASAIAGVGKEVFDRGQPGKFFSRRDLVWDALGTVAGYVLVKQIR